MPPQWSIPPSLSPAMADADPATLRMPAAFDRLAAPPLFITGHGRSGTTLTFDLFASHPEVCAIFETWLLTPHVGVTGVFHQPQWDARFYAEQQRKIGHSHAAVQLISYAEAAADLGDLLASWLMRPVQDHQRFLVEKSPIDVHALAAMFPSARLVHVIRDGRDVAGSVRRASATWAPHMTGDVARAARSWEMHVRELREESPALDDRYLEIRFEELRGDARATATRLFDFAGIPYDAQLLDAVVAATAPEAYSADSRTSGFRGAGEVSGWRAWMTRDEGAAVDEVAGALLTELGYADSRDWWKKLSKR